MTISEVVSRTDGWWVADAQREENPTNLHDLTVFADEHGTYHTNREIPLASRQHAADFLSKEMSDGKRWNLEFGFGSGWQTRFSVDFNAEGKVEKTSEFSFSADVS